MKKKSLIYVLFFSQLMATVCVAQTRLSEQQVVDLILKNHPQLKASELTIVQNKALQKTAINLPNPELIAESPTGEFMTVGVLQSVDFPAVYGSQYKLNKLKTELARTEYAISLNDVKYEAKLLYMNIQYAYAVMNRLKTIDSLFSRINQSAEKQYTAGEIDYMALTYSRSQYGEVHNRYVIAEANFKIYTSQFKILTGYNDSIVPDQLNKSTLQIPVQSVDTSLYKSSPLLKFYQQSTLINKQQWKLEKHKALPGLVGGYLNQGAANTPNDLRVRAGITVPLWFWQYAGNIKAAKYGYEASVQTLSAKQKNIAMQQQEVRQQVLSGLQTLNYYETTGNKQTNDLINTAKRFFEAGKLDYINYLRAINDANEMAGNYLQALRIYNESVLKFHYLNGTL